MQTKVNQPTENKKERYITRHLTSLWINFRHSFKFKVCCRFFCSFSFDFVLYIFRFFFHLFSFIAVCNPPNRFFMWQRGNRADETKSIAIMLKSKAKELRQAWMVLWLGYTIPVEHSPVRWEYMLPFGAFFHQMFLCNLIPE